MPLRAQFRNAALIYNPLSGRWHWKRQRDLGRACSLLAAYGIKTACLATTEPGSATEMARAQVAAGRDLIIACGGDGTINEIVNGLAGSAVPLAVLPAGTGNVLAKELGLPRSIWHAAEIIPQGKVRRIALGQANGRYFICVGGAGADASIVHHLRQHLKLRLGMLSYWLEGFRQLFTYDFPLFTVWIGREKHTAAQVVVGRTVHFGGPVKITRRANLFGDDFEVCLFPRRFRLVYLVYFAAQLVGALERFPAVRFLRARALRVEPCDRLIYFQLDGELAGKLPAEFRIVPDALSLLVPVKREVDRWTR